MPHIHTEPGQHDHTASAYIIRMDGDEPRILLHKHKLLGVYMQIGGHIELHENPWQAISHEVEEECGYVMNQLQILQPEMRLQSVQGATMHPQPVCVITHGFKGKNHYHIDTAYAFVTREDPAKTISDGESADIRWFTLDELNALDASETFEDVREISRFILEKCLPAWQVVATAEFK